MHDNDQPCEMSVELGGAYDLLSNPLMLYGIVLYWFVYYYYFFFFFILPPFY